MTQSSPSPEPRWVVIRPVRSLTPATYRCPFCDELLHAMSDHLLVAPDGDRSRRRHAHTACVQARLHWYVPKRP
jgi:hypothetical protein